jgi:hypothetical protein
MGKLRIAAALTGFLAIAFTCSCSSAAPPISVGLAPSATQTDQGASVGITATVSNGASNSGVSWSLSGPGSLTHQSSLSVTYVGQHQDGVGKDQHQPSAIYHDCFLARRFGRNRLWSDSQRVRRDAALRVVYRLRSTAQRTEPRPQHRYDQRHAGRRRYLVFRGATHRWRGCDGRAIFSEHRSTAPYARWQPRAIS